MTSRITDETSIAESIARPLSPPSPPPHSSLTRKAATVGQFHHLLCLFCQAWSITPLQLVRCMATIDRCSPFYHMSGNIGDIFNLAVWWSGSKLPNFYHQICTDLLTILCPCCATAKFNDHQYFRMYGILSHVTPPYQHFLILCV